MVGTIWVTDREPGIRLLFGELIPEAEVIEPSELPRRLAATDRPDALVIDGTQLLELAQAERDALLGLPRVLVCTGIALSSLPMHLVAGPGVVVLAKPFCVEDLEAAVEWLRGAPRPHEPLDAAAVVAASQPRSRRTGGRRPIR